ncbi:WhiB family transcriptional regulator [Streptomyces sp. NPDC058280]|uniref:WhiB family transcriptional regulator n=1 Tax=Streptomyces sp. NPDC058280 TaxID=3346419 RepID=UPI0036EEB4FD
MTPPDEPDWALGACTTGEDPELWFSGERTEGDREDTDTALRICRGCPIKDDCLATALAQEQGSGLGYRHGIRGGLTAPQRYHLWKNRHRRKAGTAA